MANKETVERIKQEYKEKGYYHVRVKLRKGGEPTDRDVVIEDRHFGDRLAERAAEVAVKVPNGRVISDHDAAQVAKSVGHEDNGWHVFEFLVRSRVGDRSVVG